MHLQDVEFVGHLKSTILLVMNLTGATEKIFSSNMFNVFRLWHYCHQFQLKFKFFYHYNTYSIAEKVKQNEVRNS